MFWDAFLQRFRPGRGWKPRAGGAGKKPPPGWFFLDKIFGGRKVTQMKSIVLLAFFIVLPSCLLADVISLTVSSTTSATVGHPGTSQIASSQMTIGTNVTAKILHLHEVTSGSGTFTGSGILTIQVNGLNFNYTETTINGAGENLPVVIGPATIIITSQVSDSITVGSATAQDNVLCTISTTQNSQCTTNQFTPKYWRCNPGRFWGACECHS